MNNPALWNIQGSMIFVMTSVGYCSTRPIHDTSCMNNHVVIYNFSFVHDKFQFSGSIEFNTSI